MAAGDIIVFVSPDATAVSFQPASGVEVVIRSILAETNGGFNNYHITDGTRITNFTGSAPFTGASSAPLNLWIGITNQYYLTIDAFSATFSTGYSGVQVK